MMIWRVTMVRVTHWGNLLLKWHRQHPTKEVRGETSKSFWFYPMRVHCPKQEYYCRACNPFLGQWPKNNECLERKSQHENDSSSSFGHGTQQHEYASSRSLPFAYNEATPKIDMATTRAVEDIDCLNVYGTLIFAFASRLPLQLPPFLIVDLTSDN